jgi:hypothetical protein
MKLIEILSWELEHMMTKGKISHWLKCVSPMLADPSKYVHPNDFDRFRANVYYAIVFKYHGYNFPYVKVNDYEGNIYRFKSDILESLPNPVADIGETVLVQNGSCAGESGIVNYFFWNLKNECFLYRIEVNGILKKRNYTGDDIARNNASS